MIISQTVSDSLTEKKTFSFKSSSGLLLNKCSRISLEATAKFHSLI